MRLQEAMILAKELMEQHGLIGWTFQFDRAKIRMGRCSCRRKLITISAPLAQLNSENEVRDTILHEIAHALAGDSAGHGILWKRQAIAIGARPVACYDAEKVVQVPAKWIGKCPMCDAKYTRHRQPARDRNYSCPPCRVNFGRISARLDWFQTR